jgi:hypothetical protein
LQGARSRADSFRAAVIGLDPWSAPSQKQKSEPSRARFREGKLRVAARRQS